MKRMKVVMSVILTNPKEPERNKKRYEFGAKNNQPYYDKKVKEGVKWKHSVWADGSGLMLGLNEFDTMEDSNKVWGDEEFQSNIARWSYLVDNCKIKIWRPSRQLPPK